MSEGNEISQMAPENIRADRERLSGLVNMQFFRIGQLVASPNNAITINWGFRNSLDFIDALLIPYADDEYNKKVQALKERMDCRVKVNRHVWTTDKTRLLIQWEPRRYFSYCIEWQKEMSELLQRSGFTEAGRGTFTIPERIDISEKEDMKGLELVPEE